MDRTTYLKQFSRRVRWSLPKAEAEEALEDYREILNHDSQADASDLVERLGSPVQAAKLLCEPRAYRRWMGSFCVMTVCLVLPEWWLTQTSFSDTPSVTLSKLLMVIGVLASLVWFHPRRSREKTTLPKGLLPGVAAMLVLLAVICGLVAALFLGNWETLPPDPWIPYGTAARLGLWLAGTAGGIGGVIGLVNARLSDRRWSAIYLLGLTTLVECVLVVSILCSMSLDVSVPNWWIPSAVEMGVLGIVGLAAAGGSLC